MSPPRRMITPVPRWPSTEAFPTRRQQRREASDSSGAPNLNQRSPTSKDFTPREAAGAQFRVSKWMNLTTMQWMNLSTLQRIAVELAACDTLLLGSFGTKSGCRIIKDLQITEPLLTQDGDVVPPSYMRILQVVGHEGTRAVHLYAHSHGNLTMNYLVEYLPMVVEKYGLTEGVSGIANLGSHTSICRIEGVLSDDPEVGVEFYNCWVQSEFDSAAKS